MKTFTPYRRFITVRDDFYDAPDRVLAHARQASYYEPEDAVGYRSTTIYHEPGIKTKLERTLGITITTWNTHPEQENGVFYYTLSNEKPGVHFDVPTDYITVLIYLTRGIPENCGTSFWAHGRTGLQDYPTRRDARQCKVGLLALQHILANDSRKMNRWRELDRIGYKPNRMLAFPSGVYHSATRHRGTSVQNGRIFQAFRIGVDWSSFAPR